MILLNMNKRDFEYDVYALIRSFYPGSELTVRYDGSDLDAELKISIFYDENRISMSVTDRDQGTTKGEDTLLAGMERPQIKNILKRLVYDTLSRHTGKVLPWGNLTGIRPVKIPMAKLELGWPDDSIKRFMGDVYQCGPQKTELALEIAKRERKVLSGFPFAKGYSLYIGIPFCPSICLYCSFGSSPLKLWEKRVDEYVDTLCREIDETCGMMGNRQLHSIYIGGGTPTTLTPDQMDRLLCRIEDRFDFRYVREFTVEAGRPDSISAEKLAVIRRHPVTRISINPQTMNQNTLDLIGRKHTVQEIKDTYFLAREMGFDNINMDLIVGLPGEGEREVEHTMGEIENLSPDSVTIHSLALKRATRLRLFENEYRDISFNNSSSIMDMTSSACRSMGLAPYYLYRQKDMAGNFENVGYAKEGKCCLYNILIMEEVQSILALGAGASTKIVFKDGRIERIENVKDVKNYIDRIDEMIERKKKGEITLWENQ